MHLIIKIKWLPAPNGSNVSKPEDCCCGVELGAVHWANGSDDAAGAAAAAAGAAAGAPPSKSATTGAAGAGAWAGAVAGADFCAPEVLK